MGNCILLDSSLETDINECINLLGGTLYYQNGNNSVCITPRTFAVHDDNLGVMHQYMRRFLRMHCKEEIKIKLTVITLVLSWQIWQRMPH